MPSGMKNQGGKLNSKSSKCKLLKAVLFTSSAGVQFFFYNIVVVSILYPLYLALCFDTPGSVCKEQHTRAMEEPILKLASVAGPVLKLELTDSMPPTWKVAHHQSEWRIKLQTHDGNTRNPVKLNDLNMRF